VTRFSVGELSATVVVSVVVVCPYTLAADIKPPTANTESNPRFMRRSLCCQAPAPRCIMPIITKSATVGCEIGGQVRIERGGAAMAGSGEARTIAAGLAYLLLISALTGCDRPPAPGELKYRVQNPLVVFVGLPAGDPRWDAVDAAARNLIRNYESVRYTVLHPADESADAIENTCRNAVQLGPQVVCVWIHRPDQAERAIQTIVAGGAAVITIGPQLSSEAMYAHVQCSPIDAAQILGANLSAIAGESRSYSLLHDSGRSPFDTDVYRRFEAGATSAFGLRKLTESYSGGNRDRAAEALAEMIDRFPNVGLIVSLDPQIWFADPAGKRLNPSNRYVTLAAPPMLWPAVRSGRAAALVGWIDGDIGRAAADFAIRSLGDQRRTGRQVAIAPELVTRETLDDFSRRYGAAAGRASASSTPVNPAGAPIP
jgi:ABC-type sugar transport system substrate-binding protein